MENHNTYLKRVKAFIKANGPKFNLTQVMKGNTDCQACGRKQIHTLFVVKSKATGTDYVVGSECQALVLTDVVDLVKLPARHLRVRDLAAIVRVGHQFGLQIGNQNDLKYAVEKVLEARRKEATRRSWVKRRAIKANTP